ncbi:MAG TPA: hypothetical protein VLA19_27515 [Herpetosiphonaceae bacterium]|nr:hypothetical protein [Herpetosiphonaceae bacterium]
MVGDMQHFPVGVVQKDGDGYIGTCDEVGTCSFGRTVEEAFSKLRTATWQRLEAQGVVAPARDVNDGRPAGRQAA